MTDPTARAVAIVGIGCVFPGAPDARTFWQNVRSGHDAISEVPAARWDPVYFDPASTSPDRISCNRGGFVDAFATFDPTRFGIMPVAVDGAEPDQLLALATAAAALDDAGSPQDRLAPERIGVVIGRGGYLTPGVARLAQRTTTAQQLVETVRALLPEISADRLEQVRTEFQAQLGPVRPESSIGLVPNLTASRIANRLDFQGPAYTVDAACASSLVAVDQAVDLLSSGRCDLVVAGGVHHCHDLTIWSVFSQLKALSEAGSIRPFDRHADGILIGEGTGLFALKRLADAERDDDRVYAVIRGTGVASDGRATSLMSPRPAGQVLALRQAWERSGLDPALVGLVEAHGTATPAGDGAELESLREVFGTPDDGRPTAGLGSVKSMIGHTMPAAGAAGLAKAAFALHHGVLPPTLHVDEPHPGLAGGRFRLVTEAEPWDSPSRLAAVNAFGFGGINGHVVLEAHGANDRAAGAPHRAPARAARGAIEPTSSAGEPVLLLAGADAAELGRLLDAFAATDGSVASLPAPGSGPARLAIVAPTPKRLELARKVLERGTPFRGRNDVWFEPEGLATAGGRVAFVYPGVEPSFDPRVDDVAALVGLPAPDVGDDPSALEMQGRGIVAVGRVLDAALSLVGARPDVVAGHSLGEWTAQIVTGMIPVDAVDDFVAEMRPGQLDFADAAFVALGCGAEQAAELCAGLADIGVSHDNCPHQSVVCGVPASARQLIERAREAKVIAQELPFRSGFHSPLFAPHVPALREQLGHLAFHPPATPLWSATTCSPYPAEVEAFRELSLRHLLEPVRFRQLIRALHDDGVRIFVQLGAGTLTGFIDDTLHDDDHLAVAAASGRHEGLAQVRRLVAGLWVEGVHVDLDRFAATLGAAIGVGTTAAPAASDGAVTLDLGTRLVRTFTPLEVAAPAPALAPAAVADLAAAGSALLAEYGSGLSEAGDAARLVLAAAAARQGAPARPAPPAAAPRQSPQVVASPAPPAGAAPAGAPRTLSREQEFSLALEPRWRDHAFFFHPPDWPDVSDTFPLVPMTGLLEVLADIATELTPEQVATSLVDIRAFRWLTVSPPTTVHLKATLDPTAPGPDIAVRASIEGHTRATVNLAPHYPTAPSPRPVHLTDPRPSPAPAERLYSDHWLFHGPEYQGITEVTDFGDDGICGWLRSPAAPGALLDNAGQLLGYWVAAVVDRDRLVLPTSIDRISYFGPHPEPGTRVFCTVVVTEIGPRSVRADLELTVDGAVWCRIDGWEDRRFDTDEVIFRMLRRPERNVLSELRPGTPRVAVATERWTDSATRDIVMRRYLRRVERDDYEGHNPRAQRQWLLGRIAAKDLVRTHLWDEGAGELYPGELILGNAADGRPTVTGPVPDGLTISLAHTDGVGVAALHPSGPVGVDIEVIEPRSATFVATVLTAAEQALAAPDGDDPDTWITRLWCAKEAAAKAAGTGLQGSPKSWEVTAVDGTALLVGDRWVATEVLRIPQPRDLAKEYVLAWTTEH